MLSPLGRRSDVRRSYILTQRVPIVHAPALHPLKYDYKGRIQGLNDVLFDAPSPLILDEASTTVPKMYVGPRQFIIVARPTHVRFALDRPARLVVFALTQFDDNCRFKLNPSPRSLFNMLAVGVLIADFDWFRRPDKLFILQFCDSISSHTQS